MCCEKGGGGGGGGGGGCTDWTHGILLVCIVENHTQSQEQY